MIGILTAMFTDQVTVKVRAGKGGDGIVSFRRERFVDRGGPDGGDGGDGGDVVFVGDRNVNTLRNFRHNQQLHAKEGSNGGSAKKHGKNGEDLFVKVPVGTVILHEERVIADITKDGQSEVVAYGGSGGFGNAHFKSSRRQAPKVAENGEEGDEFDLQLELKLLADVGLVGLPNAGKSTFLSVVSNAKPEIADYPFTTLAPNLGVADIDNESLLIADIPGLIEGASEGKGLGDDFLRHVERTAVLLHLVDAYSDSLETDYKTIEKELKDYKIDLSGRPTIVVLSKTDGLDDEIIADQMKTLKKAAKGKDILTISSQAKQGLDEVLRAASKLVATSRQQQEKAEEVEDDEAPVYTLNDDSWWKVEKGDKGVFIVTGPKIQRFARRTNYENEWGVVRLKDIMGKLGIRHELERQGAEPGDTIYFGNGQKHKIEF